MYKKAIHSNTSFKLNSLYLLKCFVRPTPFKGVQIKANRNYYVHIPQWSIDVCAEFH